MARHRRTYDHRFRELVRQSGDITIATKLGVPRSTAAGWLRAPPPSIVTTDTLSESAEDLHAEIATLRRRARRLSAIVRVLLSLLRACDSDLVNQRVPDGRKKQRLLRAIERARDALPLRRVLRLLGLSVSRYYAWRRLDQKCQLDDHSSCPRTSPQQLTPDEIHAVRDMVTSSEHRHVPTATLAILAQRLGRVFASPTTWYKLVRKHGWRRPRLRVHPPKPKVGIRADTPNEIWHIDTTVIRLLDGTKAYVYAVIDNFSRRILSWRVADRFDPGNTLAILLDASRSSSAATSPPTVMADNGVENDDRNVDELIRSGLLRRVLTMTELCFSNSMIEAWWRTLKHQWLFLNTLDSVEKVRKLVAFYVAEHNERIPHSAFRGQTPDEMYFGLGSDVPAELDAAKRAARLDRLAANRARSCPTCEPAVA